MWQTWLDQVWRGTRQRFVRTPVETTVRVDRDQLRTTLMQCEHELREMHRLVQKSAVMQVPKPAPPAPRY